jgi:SAM-dependent methyltransferase
MERLMFDMETARWESEIEQYDADHLRLRQVAMILQSLSVESVFDIGCGHGHLGTLLPGIGYSGCDMIDGAGASFSFTRCNVNRDRLPEQIGDAPAVSCSGLLEYVDDLPKFFLELRSRMRAGTWLVVTYYNMNHLSRIFDLAVGRTFGVHRGWRGFYSTRALGRMLDVSGFRLEKRYVTRFGLEEPPLSDTVTEHLRLPRYVPGGYLLAHQIIYVARAVG